MSNILLFVDDSVTMQTVAEITFHGSDWEYQGARTADEARSSNGKSPKIVLVDVTMPDGSGYDLAKELKSANSSAIVLMLCGNSSAYDTDKGAAAGCDGHIVKPWQTDKILAKLGDLLKDGPSKGAVAKSAGIPSVAVKTPPPLKTPAPAPRSATLMGIPALEMPVPSRPLPAGVAAIKSSKKSLTPKPATPALRTPPPRTPPPPPRGLSVKKAAVSQSSEPRAPMIKKAPGKPIRLVLASQATATAHSTAVATGMSSEDATGLNAVSREMLEKIIWEVVPDLAEAIIRENLDTLTAKSQ